jgi:hypothetical protein
MYIPVPLLDTSDLPDLREPVVLPAPAVSGEYRLLVAILRQALLDYTTPAYHAQAQAWLHSTACEVLCEWLEVDAGWLRQIVQQDMRQLRRRLGQLSPRPGASTETARRSD